MNRAELIEKVAEEIEFYYGNSDDVLPLANNILSTILTALQEPTEEMLRSVSPVNGNRVWGLSRELF